MGAWHARPCGRVAGGARAPTRCNTSISAPVTATLSSSPSVAQKTHDFYCTGGCGLHEESRYRQWPQERCPVARHWNESGAAGVRDHDGCRPRRRRAHPDMLAAQPATPVHNRAAAAGSSRPSTGLLFTHRVACGAGHAEGAASHLAASGRTAPCAPRRLHGGGKGAQECMRNGNHS